MDLDYLYYNDLYMESENGYFAEFVNQNYLRSIFNGTNFDFIQQNLRLYKMLSDETFITTFTSFITFYRGYLNQVLEKFILEAHQHGFVDYWRQRIYPFGDVSNEIEPKILTMYMLSAGFYIWLGSIGVACIVFIGEHIKFMIEVYWF